MAREESLILEIVWNDNLWRGACRDPLGNSNCTGEAYNIWYPDKGDVEKINARKPSECGDPSVPGRCAESAIFSQWEYLRWPKTAPAPNRMPRYIFFVSEQPGGSHAQGHFLRGFYTVTGIEKRDEGARAVLGDPNASSWFHPSIEIKLEDYTEPVNFMVSRGKYISHNVADNLAERWLKEELQQHMTLLEEYAGDEKARKEIEMIISKIERALMASNNEPPEEPPTGLLRKYFISQGLHFTAEQLATFYTALKTKGFVILTGISGTGKTKLAQYFAELFFAPERTVTEEPEDAEAVIRLQIQPYMLKYTRLIVPKGYWKLLDVPAAGETVEVELTFDGKSETCRLTHASYGTADYLQILFRGKARKWLTANFHEDDIILLEPAFSDEGDFIGFYLRKPETRQIRKREPNFYFASVRPDWKDSKSLLGYYNPLSEQFESTNFLRFILKAHQDLAVPYFILFDEMNLAKVEYYFADFLSVLESGRREDGFTQEAIRFQYPEGIDGPPPKLRLPPNLYFIGTVNVDETTYMFSPKVLDRAFTLELSEVDFAAYPSERGDGLSQEELEALRARLLPDFTNQGRFAIVDKDAVADFVRQYPTHREHLTELNALLRSHDLHFGYRVFDEIMMFLISAEGSPVFDGFGPDGLDAAFDAAVLMKVLPKFHGTRGKLREPLEKIVEWAREPDNPEAGRQALSDKLQNTEGIASLREDLHIRIEGGTTEERADASAFVYLRTALKALRMLHDLHTTGFASFA
jgi:hypothetical protein